MRNYLEIVFWEIKKTNKQTNETPLLSPQSVILMLLHLSTEVQPDSVQFNLTEIKKDIKHNKCAANVVLNSLFICKCAKHKSLLVEPNTDLREEQNELKTQLH